MAMNIQQRSGKYQLRVTHKLLPKPFFATFDAEGDARSYGTGLTQMLDRGVVPVELLNEEVKRSGPKVFKMLEQYETDSTPAPAPSDLSTLRLLKAELGDKLRTTDITTRWTDDWIRKMKVEQHLAPSTIRKRVESLARALEWHIRMTTKEGEQPVACPLRNLPRGYSNYTPTEAAALKERDLEAKQDQERNRRLSAEEEQRIREVLAGAKRPDKERAWTVDPAFALLFDLILNTGLRLSEAYRLTVDQYDQKKALLHVNGSKGHRGKAKPRLVPLTPELNQQLTVWCEGKQGMVFPFWDEDNEPMANASNRLSKRFKSLFDYALVPDCTEHDLRHEATCRWITMRTKSGNWMWGEAEICKIMGWSNNKMLMRYLSLRGEDFSNRMIA